MTEALEQNIVVGRISGPYGIKGWIRIFSYTDPIEQILSYSPWQLRKGREDQSLTLHSAKRQGKGIVALPTGFADRTQAEALTGWEIEISRSQLPDLEDGEFYWHQLEGLLVINQNNEVFGVVDHLMETGANDVLVVTPGTGSIDDRQRLIPFVEKEVITGVDLGEGRILVNWDSDF